MVAINDNCALLDNFTKLIRETNDCSGVNHLYSVAALTDNNGAVIERYRYSAYGQRTVLEADGTTVRAASLHGNQIGFTGRYLDAETNLYYFRARYYSGTLGRFISRDPLRFKFVHMSGINVSKVPSPGDGYPDGLNFYQGYFVSNMLDPSGMVVCCRFDVYSVDLILIELKGPFYHFIEDACRCYDLGGTVAKWISCSGFGINTGNDKDPSDEPKYPNDPDLEGGRLRVRWDYGVSVGSSPSGEPGVKLNLGISF